MPMTPQRALADLWQLADGPPAALRRATIGGRDPVLPSIFRVGLSETPPHWRQPPVPLGTHPPEWPAR